jgi:hypothetical protein
MIAISGDKNVSLCIKNDTFLPPTILFFIFTKKNTVTFYFCKNKISQHYGTIDVSMTIF